MPGGFEHLRIEPDKQCNILEPLQRLLHPGEQCRFMPLGVDFDDEWPNFSAAEEGVDRFCLNHLGPQQARPRVWV